jgi:regulator of replication initiation timing
LSDSLIF